MLSASLLTLAAYEFKAWDLILLSGLVMVIAALMIKLRKRSKRVDREGPPREQLERVRQQSAMRGDLEHLMVEIEQLAKRLGTQLDAKTLHLEKTMREAEKVIARLESVKQTGAPDVSTPAQSVTASAFESEIDPFTRSVCELADQGLAPKDIANQLNEHIGKVELVLALRKT